MLFNVIRTTPLANHRLNILQKHILPPSLPRGKVDVDVDVCVSDNPPDVPPPDHQAAGHQGPVQVPLLRPGSQGELALLQPQHHQEGSFLLKVGDLAGDEDFDFDRRDSRY